MIAHYLSQHNCHNNNDMNNKTNNDNEGNIHIYILLKEFLGTEKGRWGICLAFGEGMTMMQHTVSNSHRGLDMGLLSVVDCWLNFLE